MDAKALFRMINEPGRAELAVELNREKERLTRIIVESIVVDLEQIISIVSLLEEEAEIEVPAETYQNAFYGLWLKGLPEIFRKFFLRGLDEKDQAFLEMRDYVLSMGSKLKTIKSGLLCVSPTVETVCPECYYRKICRLARQA